MLKQWLNEFTEKIKDNFSERIVFIGIQGSYARCEANENSDIDVVVILDEISYNDIKRYDEVISTMPMRDKICGFFSGKQELENWSKSDLFQFYYDTVPLYKNLDFIKDSISFEDVLQAVKIGACNIYHMCVHNAVHEKSVDILKALLKSSVFVIQAKYFLEQGKYIKRKADLLENVSSEDKEIILLLIHEKYSDINFVSDKLINWTSNLICKD